MDPEAQKITAKPAEFNPFWAKLGRLVVRMMGTRAHGEITIQIQDGQIKYVRVNQGFLPGNIPQV